MKIIFVISAMNGGGAERVITTLANRYARWGDEVTILMVAGDEVAYPLYEKVHVLSIDQPSHGNPIRQVRRLYRMRGYFRKRPDSVVISFGTQINLFTIISTLGLRGRVIVSERNDPRQCRYVGFRNLVYSLCGGFVFQTGEARACFPKRIRERSAVIPNPIRKDIPDVYGGIREKKIAAVGRLEPQKNHRLLLEAFREFRKEYPEYTLHLFGAGSLERSLREQAKRLEIEKNVFFEGFCGDVMQRIRTYSMYVLSSDYEGIPNSLLEAMAVGLPCIATDCPIGGSALCIRNGENGLLVPVGDATGLAEAMGTLAADPELAESLGERAARVRTDFAEETIAELWHDVIRGASGGAV